MKLSEILKDWLIKKDSGAICTWLSNGRESDAYIDGYNTALTSCDREIDREALKKVINDWTASCEKFELKDLIISTMPQWLKRIDNGKI